MCRTVRRDGFGDAFRREASRGAGFVEGFVQAIRDFIEFEFQADAVQYEQVFIAQPVNLRVQERTQFLRVHGRGGECAHAWDAATAHLSAQRERAAGKKQGRDSK